MAYTRINWKNSAETPLDADNLNHMDEAIEKLAAEMDKKIDADKIADRAVTGNKIALYTVTGGNNGNIAQNTINNFNLMEGAVQEENIDDEAVSTAKLANGSVTLEKLSAELKNTIDDRSIKDFEHVTGDGTLQFDSYYGKGDDLHIYRITSADKAFYDSFNIARRDVCYFVPNAYEQYIFVPVGRKLFIRQSVGGGFPGRWEKINPEPAWNSVTTEKIVDGAVTAEKLSADVKEKIDTNTADITQLKSDVLDNAEAITQNTADIDQLKVKTLPSIHYTPSATITTIPPMAFCANGALVSVSLTTSTLATVGADAFAHCTNLKKITIGDKVKTIGFGAFKSCTSLESVVIPNNVTTVDRYAFNSCGKLKSVEISSGITKLSWGVFGGTGLTELTIPSSVTTIEGRAFGGCYSLESVTIPSSVTTIDSLAFEVCTSLTNVTIEDGFNANNLDLSASTKYTADTIVSWLNALADRTGQTQYTLKIGATNKAKLTAEQLAIATNKNWNIA